jgi:hypothetical protein
MPNPKPRAKTRKPKRSPAADLTRLSEPAPEPVARRSRERTADPEPGVSPERILMAAQDPIVAPPDAIVASPDAVVASPDPIVASPDPVGRRPLPDQDVFVLHDHPSPGGAGDEDPAHVLQRLVDPVGTHATPGVDPSVIRSRLARTAALKKPGGRAQEHRMRNVDPHEDPPA